MLRLIQWLTRREGLFRVLNPLLAPFNPFLSEHRNNPELTWRRLRETDPVHRSKAFGSYIATRYDDVLFLLRDANFTTDRGENPVMKFILKLSRRDPVFSALLERNLLTIDGAEHKRLRGLVSKAFTPRRVEQMRPRLQTIVDDLLDSVSGASEIDLVEEFAHPVPVIAIAEMLGVPSSDRDRFKAWSSQLVQLLDPLQGRGGAKPMTQAAHEIFGYFEQLLDQRRTEPRDDLLTAMIQAEDGGQTLDSADLLALSSLLLVAGHETTSNLIGNAVVALLRYPDERKRLQDDPSLITSAIDEVLRFESPIQLTDRMAKSDCELGGKPIRRGQIVASVLAAANRDPARFPDPDRFDIGRTDNHHLAFGQGNHFCIGSQLARLEAEVAIGSLLKRFPDFTGHPNPPAWRRSMIIRGPETLPVRLS